MRAFLRTISLAGFTALWLSRLCSLVCATSNVTTLQSGPTTPSPPYSLQDPTFHPGSPGGYGPLPPSHTRRNSTVEPPFHALATHSIFAIGPGNQQVFHRNTGVSHVQKIRERVTREKKLISKYRRLHGIKRTCNHKRWKKPCFCGVPPDELDEIFQSLVPKPTGGLANITGTGGSTSGSVNIQVFLSDPDDFLPALSSSSSGFPPWPNSSQPILAEAMAANKPPFTSEPSAAHRETLEPEPTTEDTFVNPETRPITQEQLIEEVRGIYAGLVMVEKKCIEIDERICINPKRLSDEQWQATIALHRTLLHEHHDLFLAFQRPSSSAALGGLTTQYAMPARMWLHRIHPFLELLRRSLPESLDLMRHFVHSACSLLALQVEAETSFVTELIEMLGDLPRYRMAIEEVDVRDREIWSGCAEQWYTQASQRSTNLSMTQEYLTVPSRATIIRRPQQNALERQLPEGFAIGGLYHARYYPLEFSQGQPVHDDEETLDMPSKPDSGGGELRCPQFLVPEDSCASAEKTLDTPAMPGTSANNFDALPSAPRSYFSEGSSTNSAPNESLLFRGIGDNFLDDATEDTEMPDMNFDDFLLAETQERPSINPLNSLFNPEMTFSVQVNERVTDLPLEEHYLAQESDWNFEFDVHMVHTIVQHVPGTGLGQKSPVTVKQKADDSVQAAEECAHDLCNSEKCDDQATSNGDAVKDKFDTGYSIDDKQIQNFSTTPDHDFGSLPAQPSFHQANAINTTILGGNRTRVEVIFCLLLVQSQRDSPNTLGTSQRSSSFLAVQIVLLLVAMYSQISSSS